MTSSRASRSLEEKCKREFTALAASTALAEAIVDGVVDPIAVDSVQL